MINLFISLLIKQIMMDFERAAIKSFQKYFPNAKIKGCLFHFGQALYKKLKKLQLSELYQNNQIFKRWIRLIFALALIPTANLMEGWQKVLEQKRKFGRSQDEVVEVTSNSTATIIPLTNECQLTTRPLRGRGSRGPRVSRGSGRGLDSTSPTTGNLIIIGRGRGRGAGRSRGRGRGRGSSLHEGESEAQNSINSQSIQTLPSPANSQSSQILFDDFYLAKIDQFVKFFEETYLHSNIMLYMNFTKNKKKSIRNH